MTSIERHGVAASRLPAALFGLALAGGIALMVVPFGFVNAGLRAGDVAPRALTAAHDAQYESEALTNALRNEAAQKVPEQYFPPDPAVRGQQSQKLADFLSGFKALRQRSDLQLPEQLAESERIPGATALSPSTRLSILTLSPASAFDAFASRLQSSLTGLLTGEVRPGAVDAALASYLEANRPEAGGVPASAVPTFREVLKTFTVPTVTVNQAATDQARADARARQPAVIATFASGQVVVPEGKVLGPADIEALEQTGAVESGFDGWRALGGAIVAAMFGVLFGVAAHALRPFERPVRPRLVVVGGAVLAAVLAARLAYPFLMPDRDQQFLQFALPLPAAAMATALVSSLAMAAAVAGGVGLLAAFAAATFPDLAGSGFVGALDAFELVLAVALGGFAGAAVLSRGSRGRDFALAGVTVTLAVAAILAAFWLLDDQRENDRLPWVASVAAASGFGSALFAAVVQAVTVRIAGYTPRATLLRLAQPRHPLLRRLEAEAPGTFHHSMMVGTLAERAAERIGADSLLARVGGWYHDIGKMDHSGYFIENMLDGQLSPHEALGPAESAAIIREHVDRGMEIGRQEGLPQAVLDFIPEHHGTRLVSFFYRQAALNEGTVDTAPYRYAGPRPRTRETAIVMLADSCEATVRATPDAAGAKIDGLVESIVAERIAEGQLDDCDLTMRDVQAIATTFKETLRAMHHPRIAYPSPPEELARLAGA